MSNKYISSGASFSPDGLHRLVLWRTWNEGLPKVAFIGLNPSTADAEVDDNTIRKCVQFAKSWGYGGIVMLNLFTFCSTNPKGLYAAGDLGGGGTDVFQIMSRCRLVVAAWGAERIARDQARNFRDWSEKYGQALHHLGLTKDGQPKHPLYLKGTTRPTLWT